MSSKAYWRATPAWKTAMQQIKAIEATPFKISSHPHLFASFQRIQKRPTTKAVVTTQNIHARTFIDLAKFPLITKLKDRIFTSRFRCGMMYMLIVSSVLLRVLDK